VIFTAVINIYTLRSYITFVLDFDHNIMILNYYILMKWIELTKVFRRLFASTGTKLRKPRYFLSFSLIEYSYVIPMLFFSLIDIHLSVSENENLSIFYFTVFCLCLSLLRLFTTRHFLKVFLYFHFHCQVTISTYYKFKNDLWNNMRSVAL
jgi:hypothetical protein